MNVPPFDVGSGPDDFPLPFGESELIEAVGDHCERFLGQCDIVQHEIVSEFVHIVLHRFPPSKEREYWTFVTSGMAEKAMHVPEELQDRQRWRYAELLLHLPSHWPVGEEELKEERNWWPLRALKQFARLPHQFETWVAPGHTMASDPPEPFAEDTDLCASILWPSFHMPDEFQLLSMPDGRSIRFYALSFLYREELELMHKRGLDALIDKLGDAGFEGIDLFVLDKSRKNVASKKRWFLGR